MALKPLNHYSLTNPASVYDEEAMTALELAGRTAAKVNEAVEAFNELDAKTGERLDKQETVQIPATVKQEVDRHIADGDFDKAINAYVGDLEQRVDNLSNSYQEGSTTADAELFDIRAGGDGQNYPTAGDASRATYGNVKSLIDLLGKGGKNNAFEMSGAPIGLTYTDAMFINNAGVLSPVTSGNTKYKVARVNVAELSFYHIDATANFGNSLFAIYNAKDELLYNVNVVNEAAVQVFDDFIFTPKNASYILIAFLATDTVLTPPVETFYRVEGLFPNSVIKNVPVVTEEFCRLLSDGNGKAFEVGGVAVSSTVEADKVLFNDGRVLPVTTLPDYYVKTAEVTEGMLYRVVGCANYDNVPYAIYDANGNVLAIGINTGVADYNVIDEIISAPANARYIRVAYNTTVLEGAIENNLTFNAASKNTWSGKKWVCIGDSLTEKNARATMNYHDYIANDTGINVVNMGVSGTGYAASGNPFHRRVANVPADADVITIFGSFNDLGAGLDVGTSADTGTSTLLGCVNTTLDNLFNAHPLARVGIVTPTPWDSVNPLTGANAYVDGIIDICRKRGIPCLDLFRCSGLRPWEAKFREVAYSHDDGNGVHPDETGHKLIAPLFREFIAGLLNATPTSGGAQYADIVEHLVNDEAFIESIIDKLPVYNGEVEG